MKKSIVWRVSLPLPLRKTFDYLPPLKDEEFDVEDESTYKPATPFDSLYKGPPKE